MDPRPNDFSYRRPRLNNLTYQSYGISESLFHVNAYRKNYYVEPHLQKFDPLSKRELPNPQHIQMNNQSRWKVNQSDLLSKSSLYGPYKNESAFEKSSLSKSMIQDVPQYQPTVQEKMLEKNYNIRNKKDSLSEWRATFKEKQYLEQQDRVYEYQQKPYNIISLHPKLEPDSHRQYPRYSLEHLILDKKALS